MFLLLYSCALGVEGLIAVVDEEVAIDDGFTIWAFTIYHLGVGDGLWSNDFVFGDVVYPLAVSAFGLIAGPINIHHKLVGSTLCRIEDVGKIVFSTTKLVKDFLNDIIRSVLIDVPCDLRPCITYC